MPRLHPKLRARAAQQSRGEGRKRKSAKDDKRDSHKKGKKPKDKARHPSSSNEVTPSTTGVTSPPAPSDNATVPPRVSAPAVLAPSQASYPPQPSFPAPSQAFVPQSLTAPAAFQGSIVGYQGSYQPPVQYLNTANLHPFGVENGPTLDDVSVAARTTIDHQAAEIAHLRQQLTQQDAMSAATGRISAKKRKISPAEKATVKHAIKEDVFNHVKFVSSDTQQTQFALMVCKAMGIDGYFTQENGKLKPTDICKQAMDRLQDPMLMWLNQAHQYAARRITMAFFNHWNEKWGQTHSYCGRRFRQNLEP